MAITLSKINATNVSNGSTVSVTNGSINVISVSDVSGNNVTFTPATGYAGVTTFQYTIDDAGLTDTQTVTVTVGIIQLPLQEGQT